MKSMLPAAFLAVSILAAPSASAQDDRAYDALLKKVDALQQEVDQLQKEVKSLTRQLNTKQAPPPRAPQVPGLEELLKQFGGGEDLEGLMEQLQSQLENLDLESLLQQFEGMDLERLMEQFQGGDEEFDLNRLMDQVQKQLDGNPAFKDMMEQFRDSIDGEQMQKMMDEVERMFEQFQQPPQHYDDETI